MKDTLKMVTNALAQHLYQGDDKESVTIRGMIRNDTDRLNTIRKASDFRLFNSGDEEYAEKSLEVLKQAKQIIKDHNITENTSYSRIKEIIARNA